MTDQSRIPRPASKDAALLARIGQGDMTAMKALYEAHCDALVRFVRPRVRDSAEADDIVHDTMLNVWRGAAGFQGRSSVRSWMLTLAHNKVVDHIRKQARVVLQEADETQVAETPDPEAVIGAAQDAARVRACLDELPERQRAVIHLIYYEEMSCAEAATVENVPSGTVKSRIYHAKQILMRCLSRTEPK